MTTMDSTPAHPHLLPGGGWMVTWRHRDGSVTVEPVVAWRFDQAVVTNPDGQLSPISYRDRDAGIFVWHPDMEYGFPDGIVLSGRDIYRERS